MKLLQLLCLIAALSLTGCKDGEKPKDLQITDDAAIDTTTTQKRVADASATWMGTYAGTLPCWKDCEGLRTEITVNADSTYTLSSQALGLEKEPRIFKGTYHLQASKNIITLDADGDHLKFLVKENSLKKLDKFGDPEQGAPQDKYVLERVK
jgi:uncharacterized lipoprotein NlpE involved in copper resistance